MTVAPLGNVSVEKVIITRAHSAVVLLADESPELRNWCWGTTGIYRGKAMGKRFRLTIDGVTIEAGKVFARPAKDAPRVFLTVTTGPGDTCAAALGRKVGRPVYEVTLSRVSATRKQVELRAKAPGQRRVTVEVGAVL